jgi:hypothetical protein
LARRIATFAEFDGAGGIGEQGIVDTHLNPP